MDKKKLIAVISLILLILLGVVSCNVFGNKAPETEPTTAPVTEPVPTQEPTEEPTAAPTEPSWVPGVVRATYGAAVYKTFNLGDKVKVKGEFDGYFIIEGEELDLLIETRYLRHAAEEQFEEREGYTYSGTEVFTTAHLTGEAIATLGLNTKVQVVEGKEDWLHITWDGGEGFITNHVSPHRIVYRGGGSDDSSGGGGGGGPADGTDIDLSGLSAVGVTGGVHLLSSYIGPVFKEWGAIEGVILTDACEAYMYLYNRDGEAKITATEEETYEVYVDGFYATLPHWLISMEGDDPYEAWTGYAKSGVPVYGKHQMREIYVERNMNLNEKVEVIDQLPHCYVVEIDGEVGYMKLDDVMKNRYVYSGGNKEESGGGGGGGYAEWTPDVK